ncbi:YbaK/EbsC family protein [Halorubellus sp. JP-L1]|uniref:YbaK/EbsC family protein n=1 Tax=Halorubellus sp. JP-L1 TaxID=2715753 RepID=UPI001409EDEE|nr:YbaK/EbsC family protein [Halorubellus sp. JP-L1]NHN40426.1 YbaK/EbsC family protein [Halorubellus sp. JP-L1]
MHERAADFTQRATDEHGLDLETTEFPEGTKTAEDAAAAVGCEVAQIASSIVLVAGDQPVVVVTSGANRVSFAKLAAERGVDESDVRMGDADEVRKATGYAIGGVPPFCHHGDDGPVPTYLDETLTEFDTVWAAAGTPEAVFPIDPDELRECADAVVLDVAE